jgi:hypothetical protein
MKNTLEFDPRILKRFVNFMNNPDERTAIDQFGDGDKYFGVCLLMCTLPGLPMFGHGQIEGFAEKYGMEFRKPQREESPNSGLIARHEREIFPLMHRRSLFAGVENFLLYDFFTPEGHVNEDVYAYSNQLGDQRALIIYHNKYAQTAGWVRSSVAFAVKDDKGGRRLVQRSLAEGLGLRNEPDWYTTFRDPLTGLEYIRNNRALWEEGLYVELAAYKSHAFVDFRQARADSENQYAALSAALAGRGVPSLEEAAQELLLGPVHTPLRELINADLLRRLTAAARDETGAGRVDLMAETETRLARLYQAVIDFSGGAGDPVELAAATQRRLDVLLKLGPAVSEEPVEEEGTVPLPAETATTWATAFSWLFLHDLGRPIARDHAPAVSRSLLDEWRLNRLITNALAELGVPGGEPERAVSLIKILITHQDWHLASQDDSLTAHGLLTSLLRDPDAQQVIGLNRYQGVLWLSREGLEALLSWLRFAALVTGPAEESARKALDASIQPHLAAIKKAAGDSGYRLEQTLAQLAPSAQQTPAAQDAGSDQPDSKSIS